MFRAPKDIYGVNLLQAFVHELGGPKHVAKFLHVTERTVWRWLSTGKVPRATVLALYWETQYGRSQIFTDQVNEIRLLYRRVCLLQEQFDRAKSIVAGLRKLHAGSANEAIFEEMASFAELPPDTYGVLTPSGAAMAEWKALESSAQAEPPTQPAQLPTRSAQVAVSAFEALRTASAG